MGPGGELHAPVGDEADVGVLGRAGQGGAVQVDPFGELREGRVGGVRAQGEVRGGGLLGDAALGLQEVAPVLCLRSARARGEGGSMEGGERGVGLGCGAGGLSPGSTPGNTRSA